MKRSLIKGLAAGVLASIISTKVKSKLEDFAPVRDDDTDSPPVVLANRTKRKYMNASLKPTQKKEAEKKIHWAFGLLVGGLYGVAAEYNKKWTAGLGSSMGTTLYSATHGSLLPALGTEPWPHKNKAKYTMNEYIGHVAFGVTTEIARRGIRKLLR